MDNVMSRRGFVSAAAGALGTVGALSILGSAPLAASADEAARQEYEVEVEDSFLDYGEYKTHIRMHRPQLADGEKCPAMLLAHGFSGNMEYDALKQIAAGIASRGVAVLQIDYTSNGESTLPFEDHSLWTDTDQAKIAIEYLRGLDWVDKVGMAGHSQGGCGTCMVASELGDGLDFAILLAPANMIPDVARTGGYQYVPDCEAWYAGIPDYFDAANPPATDDILEGTGTKYNYFESVQDIDMWDVCSQITCPVQICWGTSDVPVALNIIAKTQDAIPDCRLRVYFGEDHSLSNRTEDIIATMNSFIDEVLA